MGHPGSQIAVRKPRLLFSATAAVKAAAWAPTAVAVVLASETKAEEGSPKGEYVSQVLFDNISSRIPLSGSGSDGQRFAHLQSIIHTNFGREKFGRGMAAFRRRFCGSPDLYPPEALKLFLRSSPPSLGEMSVDQCPFRCDGGDSALAASAIRH